MPKRYTEAEKLHALQVLETSAKVSGDAPVWSRCARELGIHKATLKRWWRAYGGRQKGEPDHVQKARQTVGSGRVGRRSAKELLSCSQLEAHEDLLQRALDAYDDAESDAGRTGALKEICRLVEAHGRKDQGARVVTPGEWVLLARKCPELVYEAVLGMPVVLERLGVSQIGQSS